MDNFFSSGSGRKYRIPKDLSACIGRDETADNLLNWSDRLDGIGRVLLVLLIIIGIVMTTVDTSDMAYLDEELAWGTFFRLRSNGDFMCSLSTVHTMYCLFCLVHLHLLRRIQPSLRI